MSRLLVPAGMTPQRAAELLSLREFQDAVLALKPSNYWPANEGVGTPQDIAGGVLTTMSGSLAWTAPAGRSNGYALDYVGDNTKRLDLSPVSYEVVSTMQLAVNIDAFATIPIANLSGVGGYIYPTSSTQWIYQSVGGTNPVWTVPAMSLGTWYLVHFVRTSGTSVTMYLNGVSMGAQAVSAGAFAYAAFGWYPSSGGSTYDGRLNHMAGWDGRALTAAQVLALYNAWAT